MATFVLVWLGNGTRMNQVLLVNIYERESIISRVINIVIYVMIYVIINNLRNINAGRNSQKGMVMSSY